MRRFFLALLLTTVVLFMNQPVRAQRFAACDLCGFCQMQLTPQPTPQNWDSCRECLYPDASDNADSMETLMVDTENNMGPTPYQGHQYTMIGCVQTDLTSFNEPGAAAGVIQLLLNIIFSVVGAVAFLYFIYGSFTILTSQAQPERINYGKRLVMGSIIGLVFTLISAFIVNFIASGILRIPGF